MDTIADRIRRARILAKYESGSDAARAFGWPVSTYLGHENGDRTPKLETIQRYAKAFRVNPSYLAYGGDEEIYNDPQVNSFVEVRGLVMPGGIIHASPTQLASGDMLNLEINLPDGAFTLIDTQGRNPNSRFQKRDVIVVKSGFTSDVGLIDQFVYIKTDQGKEYIRILRRGNSPRRYDLYHPDYHNDVISSVLVDELGVIVMIIPGGFYSDLGIEPIPVQVGPTLKKA